MKTLRCFFDAFFCVALLAGLATCQDFYEGCQVTKGCHGDTKNCVADKSCGLAMSYEGIAADKYRFEIIAQSTGDLRYIAAGPSTSQSMFKASVVVCRQKEGSVEMYWNVAEDYDSVPLADTQLGLSETSLKVEDGFLRCSFVRDAKIEFETPDAKPKNVTFDLNSDLFTLIFASGQIDSQTGKLKEHQRRVKTDNEHFLSDFNKFLIAGYGGCSTTKGCFGHPDGCVGSRNCTVLATYTGITPSKYKFELLGKVDNDTSAYVATGISLTPVMSDTSVIACSKFSSETRIEMYWNDGYDSLPVNPTDTGLSEPTVEYSDGYLHCSVIREATTKFQTPSDSPKEVEFDLNNVPYYLLLAYGGLNTQGRLKYHTNRHASTDKLNIFDYGKIHPIYSGCSTEKGCFGYPDGCIEHHNCSMMASYVGIAADKYRFEIYGKADAEDSSYAAVGLGPNPAMGDASVMACSKFNDKVRVEMYWNEGHSSKPLANTSFGLSGISGELVDGYLYCSVVRQAAIEIQTPTSPTPKASFDLNTNPFHLLLARGPLNDLGLLTKHSEKVKSNDKVELFKSNPFNDDVYQGCGVTKGCFGMPASCETSKNCELIVTYVTLEGSGDVTFTISSGSAGVDQYLGVGLGGSEEMYDANVMFCYALNNGTTDVAMSWNDPSGRASPILEDPTIGLKDQRSKFENGKLGCAFTRDKTSTFKTPS